MEPDVNFKFNLDFGASAAQMGNVETHLEAMVKQFNILNNNFISFSQKSTSGMGNLLPPINQVTDGFSKCTNKVLLFTQSTQGLQNLSNALIGIADSGLRLNTSLTDLSAITGVTGGKLKEIEMAARASAKVFGTDAAQNVEAYKLILSQLDPKIAENSEALKLMGNHINILSKTMGGDTVAATNVLTTAMNQYGVSTKDPIYASKVMAEMMNVMSAAAQEGSAELPQIQQALQQSGMMAKTAGVGFVELNAAIQVLDKAGKKGAEGGVAIRNMLAELSQGAMNSPKTIAMLQANGISIDALADKSKTFSQRLQLLKPIANDTAAMTQLFGKENVAAAIALAMQTDEMDRYTGAITGTNSAVEQANVVMSSHQERINRLKAGFEDLKIKIYNVTSALVPYLGGFVKLLTATAGVGSGIAALTSLYTKLIPKKVEDTTATAGGAVANGFFAKTMNMVRNATTKATMAVRGLSLSIINIPIIGWIAAAIMLVVAAFKILWDRSKSFREALFGIWEAAKAVFNNIGLVLSRVYNMVIKPIITFIGNLFSSIWGVATTVFNNISTAIGNFISWVWNGIVAVGTSIGNFFAGIWKWVKNLFGGVGGFINEWLIQPISNAFNKLWDIITGVFNKIMDGLKKIFAPIVKLWNKIFSGDGMEDVGQAYEEGEKKGAESYEEDQLAKTPAKEAAEKEQFTSLLSGLGTNAASSAITGSAGNSKSGNKSISSSLGGSNNKPTTINLTIHKLQDKIEIHTTNLQTGAKQAGQKVVEELLMALQSVNAKVEAA